MYKIKIKSFVCVNAETSDGAIKNFQAMLNNCLDHKTSIIGDELMKNAEVDGVPEEVCDDCEGTGEVREPLEGMMVKCHCQKHEDE